MRVMIADDELLARKRLTRLVEAMDGVELVATCASGDEALEALKQEAVDVLLLDIQMPGLTGLDAIQLLPAPAPHVVFCTAYSDHAVEAFEHGAVDYLMKPIEPGRLQKALGRVRERMASKAEQAGADDKRGGDGSIRRLAIGTRKGIVLLDPEKVSHAVIDGELVKLVCDGQSYITDFTLNDLEARLPEDRFVRVHRQGLINLDGVDTLEPLETGGYTARMKGGDIVTVSRSAARKLRKRFNM
jgi:two-component system LytT family response regulator